MASLPHSDTVKGPCTLLVKREDLQINFTQKPSVSAAVKELIFADVAVYEKNRYFFCFLEVPHFSEALVCNMTTA